MTRTEEFSNGAERVRSPQFETVQSQHNRNFQPASVLDTPYAIPNQNGMGQQDLQRRMIGFRDAASGRAQSTYDQQIWLKHPDTSPRTRKKDDDGS